MKIDEDRLRLTKQTPNSLQMRLHSFSILTKTLIRLGVSANQTTLLSCMFGMFGVYLLYNGFRILSVPILYFYSVLDYSDGWIARYNGTASDFGYNLDHANHTLVVISMLVVSSLASEHLLIGGITILFFLISIWKPYHETGVLGSSYSKIRGLGVQFFVETGTYLGIILNRLEVLILAHLILYAAVFVLSVVAKIKELNI